ncbi:MAG: YlmC/YmxH family sporulation protein [Bacilli bacterium]|nr:YlmC/YmxH family sporulation protein [bacterium]MDY3757097.1 YlmC/YmxH family sporulation protein [Bacilli bacterium]
MSDLQRKDIINMTTGSRIGKIIDIDVNEDGLINSLIVGELKMMKRFNNSSETRISFKQIKTIGSDVILVDLP